MLSILITWLFMAVTSFLTGAGALFLHERLTGWHVRHLTMYCLTGMAVLTAYAQYFSLIGGVRCAAVLFMIFADLCILFLYRAKIKALLIECCACLKASLCRPLLPAVCLIIAVLLFAYGSSRGYMHYDTGLYHAQSIRWVEEYGVVPGLANLHSRFGYNSAAFPLCALFSFGWLLAEPMHCTAGFFALLLAIRCGSLFSVFYAKRAARLSDLIRVGAIFYLVAVFRELVSPASDYFAMLTLFYVATSWADLMEVKERTAEDKLFGYALLSEVLVFAVTVKLSCAAMLVLVLYPAILLLRTKRFGAVCGYLSCGLILALPYFIRGVLISGWMMYPFTLFDFFPVDWKIDRMYAASDANEISAYAKEIYDVYQLNQPISVWIPAWFKNQAMLDKLFILAAYLSIPAGLLWILLKLLQKFKGAYQKEQKDALLGFVVFELSAICGFLFWQFGAPLVRYGYFYVLFLPCVTAALWLFQPLRETGNSRISLMVTRGFQIALVLFLLYRSYNLVNMITEFVQAPYYLQQMTYGEHTYHTYDVDGVTIYVPDDRGQIGYHLFPSSPIEQNIELRGDSLRQGFRQK